ncbi:YggT family protein [Sphingomonas kyeonggiensis]|uniref:YggT family protein n=1 Tax=Sphingomonas kyeonggiensis TaxID=1268553 RepID=UPI0027D7D22B|nr:YggT family protein [Sphingomonas kyeonggiensis]
MLLQVAQYLLWVLSWIIIIQAILSWLIAFNVINTYNDFVRSVWQTLEAITRPIYRPIRRIMPDFGALDLSPLVALLLIIILKDFVLNWAIAQLAGAIY